MDKEELIRLRAFEIWIGEGMPEGREREHWLQARREIEGMFESEDDEPAPGSRFRND
jgi:hypothetical protein